MNGGGQILCQRLVERHFLPHHDLDETLGRHQSEVRAGVPAPGGFLDGPLRRGLTQLYLPQLETKAKPEAPACPPSWSVSICRTVSSRRRRPA